MGKTNIHHRSGFMRLLAALLCAVCVFGLVPTQAFAFRRGRKQAPGWVTTMWGLTDSIITRRRLTLTWSIIPMGQWT